MGVYVFMFLFLVIIFTLLMPITVNGESLDMENQIHRNLEVLDTKELEKLTEDNLNFDFKNLMINTISGEVTLSPTEILNNFINELFKDIKLNLSLLVTIVILGILSSVLTNMTDSFKETTVGELAFFVCFIAIIISLYNSFNIAYGIGQNLLSNIYSMIIASIPLVFGTIALSGSPAFLYTYGPIIMFLADTIIVVVNNYVFPLILVFASIEIINNITHKEVLTVFCKNGKWLIKWIIKGMAILFMAVLSMQRIAAPVADGLVSKSAKLSLSALPVVGQVLSEAVDTALYIGDITKNGALLAVIIVFIMYVSFYFIKLISFLVVYKIMPIILEPIGDKRIIKTIDVLSDYIGIIISSTGLVAFLFIFSLIIAVSV